MINYVYQVQGQLCTIGGIKSWDIQNLLIVSQTFELSLKIKIVIKELNFNLMFLTICHNFHNLICKKPNLHNVYF
jgi:hypothetical protein